MSAAISMKEAVETLGPPVHPEPARCDASLQPRLVGRAAEADRGRRAGRSLHWPRSGRWTSSSNKGLIVARDAAGLRAQRAHGDQAGGFEARYLEGGPISPGARVQRTLVIGNPRTVPVGQYSEESLKAMLLWDQAAVEAGPGGERAPGVDYPARGEVDAGFVYTTDTRGHVWRCRRSVSAGGRHLPAGDLSGRGGEGHEAAGAGPGVHRAAP